MLFPPPVVYIPTEAFLMVQKLNSFSILPSNNQIVPHCPGIFSKNGSSLSPSKIISFSKP